MRHGTWVETGGGSGSGRGAVGVIVAGLVGLWVAVQANPPAHSAAVRSAQPAPALAGVQTQAAAHVADAGHGVGWWSLMIAALFAVVVLLAVLVAAALWPELRRRTASAGSHSDHDEDSSGPERCTDASVIVLADYARSNRVRTRTGEAMRHEHG